VLSSLPAVTLETIELPSREQLEAVQASLNPEGAQEFAEEFFEALWLSKERGDLRPVQDVIDAWYGSLLLVKKYPEPRDLEAVLAARKRETPMTYDEVKASLGA
jgi:hypothetical protein